MRRRVQPFRRSQFRVLGRLGNSFAVHDRIVEAVQRWSFAALLIGFGLRLAAVQRL